MGLQSIYISHFLFLKVFFHNLFNHCPFAHHKGISEKFHNKILPLACNLFNICLLHSQEKIFQDLLRLQ